MRDAGTMRRIEVRIPPGVRDGSRVRVASEGSPSPFGGPKGDLYLVVSIAPHKTFERKDDDLHIKVPVPLHVAVLGGEVEVPTLKGGKLALRIPPETQNGRKIRLANQGMPRTWDSRGRQHLFHARLVPHVEGSGDIHALDAETLPRLREWHLQLLERPDEPLHRAHLPTQACDCGGDLTGVERILDAPVPGEEALEFRMDVVDRLACDHC